MKFALVINNRVRNIILSDTVPVLSFMEGFEFLLIDVTELDVQEGDKYDSTLDMKFIHRPVKPEVVDWHGYFPVIYWSEEDFEWVVDYKPTIISNMDFVLEEVSKRDYRVLKAFKLGVSVDDVYPGESEWYFNIMSMYHAMEEDYRELTGEYYKSSGDAFLIGGSLDSNQLKIEDEVGS